MDRPNADDQPTEDRRCEDQMRQENLLSHPAAQTPIINSLMDGVEQFLAGSTMHNPNDEFDGMDPLVVMIVALYVGDLLVILFSEDDPRRTTPTADRNDLPANAHAFGPDDEFQLNDAYRAAENLGVDLQSTSVLRLITELNALTSGIPIFPFGLPPISTGHNSMSDIANQVAKRNPFEGLARLRRDARRARMDRMRQGRASDITDGVHKTLNPASANYTREMIRRSMLFSQLISLGAALEATAANGADINPNAEDAANKARAFTEGRRRAEEDSNVDPQE